MTSACCQAKPHPAAKSDVPNVAPLCARLLILERRSTQTTGPPRATVARSAVVIGFASCSILPEACEAREPRRRGASAATTDRGRLTPP